MIEAIIGVALALVGAIFGGKLWGARKYQQGQRDQVDAYSKASESAAAAIKLVDGMVEADAEKARQKANDEASALKGKQPTPRELDEFFAGVSDE
jgi:hypothetical protein